MHESLLWLDVETDGLEEATGHIFEVGMALTDGELNEVASVEVVVGWRDWSLPMSDYVRDMHTKNGLLKEVAASRTSLYEAEGRLVEFVHEHDALGLYMAGSGVHFDRRWVQYLMPTLARLFHYRNFDLTTLRYFFGDEKTEPPHRALPDLRQNIAELRRYVERARALGLVALPKAVIA